MATNTLSLAENKRYTLYTQFLNAFGAAISLILGLWIMIDPARRTDPAWVFWLIWPIATLHTLEEYIFPGGFLVWFNRFAFNSSDPYLPLSAKRAFQTDALAGLMNPLLIILFSQLYFPLVFTFVFLLWFNAYFHIIESIKHGKYFPGTITSILLYVPGLSYVVYFYVERGLISLPELSIGFFGALALTAFFYAKVRNWQRQMVTQ